MCVHLPYRKKVALSAFWPFTICIAVITTINLLNLKNKPNVELSDTEHTLLATLTII